MTTSDTVGRVARPRGVLTTEQQFALREAREAREMAIADYRVCVLRVLEAGASFNEVSKETGLSKDTLQRWKREAGK